MEKLFTPRSRLWIYTVLIAAFGVAASYGWIEDVNLSPLMYLAAAVCGLAAANVPGSNDGKQ